MKNLYMNNNNNGLVRRLAVDSGFLYNKNCRFVTTQVNPVKELHPWWVTGFVDGEGSFIINTTKSKTTKIGYSVKLIFSVSMHHSDEALLHKLRAFFKGAGHIIHTKKYVAYRVENFSEIMEHIIPHFLAYPCQSTKFINFYLFKAVADLVNKKEHLSMEGYIKLLSFKAAFKKGMEASIFKSELFSSVVPHPTKGIFQSEDTKLAPEFIAGFVAADGSFFISRPLPSSKWPNYDATFTIAQDKRDIELLNRMIKTLGCGKIRAGSSSMRYLTVRNKQELHDIILPFFTKYNLNSEKRKDFINFSTSLVILYNNLGKGLDNLSQDNINKLEDCINSMNKNRYSPISDLITKVGG